MIKDVHIKNLDPPSLRGRIPVPTRLISRRASEIMEVFEGGCDLKSSEIGIAAEVDDSVLYHSPSGSASGQQIRVVCPRQRPSAHWFTPAKCAQWHFQTLARLSGAICQPGGITSGFPVKPSRVRPSTLVDAFW